MNAKYVFLFVFFVLIVSNLNGGEPARAVNITRTDSHFELKPKFVLGGKAIAFMIFDGNFHRPGLADYRLVVTDLDGNDLIYKSDVGVIDYRVCENDEQLEMLLASGECKSAGCEPDDFDFNNWEIRRLDLKSGQMHLLESAQGRSLHKAYEQLGLPLERVLNSGGYVAISPDGSRQVAIKLELSSQNSYIWTFTGNGETLLLASEAWLSYTDAEWQPPVLWITNDTFLTVGFTSDNDADFPQSEGVFSIYKIDLSQNRKSVLYQKRSHRPIAKMSYSKSSDDLFFQASIAEQGMGLYKLNLFSGDAGILYKTTGDLGGVHFGKFGSTLIFADFNETNSDVIRVDLGGESVRLAVQ